MSLNVSRKYIFFSIIILVIVGLLISYFIGTKQDQNFRNEDAIYSAIIQHIQEEKYEEALLIAEGLNNQIRKSETLNYVKALSFANTGEFDKAANHMQRAIDLNPYKVEDSMFMLQFGEILMFAERKEDAKVVLDKCATLSVPESYPDYKERVQQLQGQLNG